MDAMLQSRIQNLIGGDMPVQMAEGGMVEPMPEMAMPEMAMAEAAPEMQQNSNAGLEMALNELMMQQGMAEDPVEQEMYERMGDAANAPMAEQAQMLAAEGRGDDTVLAHLRPGEVVLPPEMFDDAQFEAAVENRFNELDIDPERHVVAMGIASLNPITGLEEFGFFKKLGKSIKKFAKKIAPVAGPLANFIPGVGPLVAGAIGAATNVVGGKGLKGAISGALGGYGAGKALGGIGSLGGASSGSAANFAKSGFFDKIGALKKGLGSLPGEGFFGKVTDFVLPGDDGIGLLGNLKNAGSYMLGAPRGSEAELVEKLKSQALASGDPSQMAIFEQIELQGLSPQDALSALQKEGVAGASSSNFFSNLISGGGADGKGNYGALGDFLGGGLGAGTGSGGLGGLLGGAGGLAAAGLLGKLAYDEAKNRKGVALTPLTQEGSTGRYNIEAEIARRTGQPAPNPVEFGLLPKGTIPTLSGGKPPQQEAATGMRYGGMVMPMAYAKGGNVATEDFERMNGGINGEGTETSDDVPAMLSDGEFVMTGQAVRGAGAFDLSKGDGGIITLTPNGGESRGDGTALMYEMMDLFAEFADKPKPKRAKKK
jgi:hypothetical protein